MSLTLSNGFLTDLKTITQTTNLRFSDLVGEINVGKSGGQRTIDTFTFNADYIVVSYEFTDGSDLDTKTRIVTPNIGQDTVGEYLGYGSTDIFPPTGNVILTWGGDNTGNGFESVLVNIAELKAQNPSATEVVIDMRALWYGSSGSNPVKASVALFRGGTMEPDGDNFTFINPTATASAAAESAGTIVTATASDSNGDRVSVLTYNLSSFVGTFNNNDTTTPEV